MITLTDERGKKIYVSREAIAVVRPVVMKETPAQGHTAVMLLSGQTLFVEDLVEDVIARITKSS